MANRAKDWLAQAERDMELADLARREGKHEWACFAAQQAAEKAVKAIHYARGQDAMGHAVATLLEDLDQPLPDLLVEKGKFLDNLYIPTRYPNGHASGAPFQHYGPIQGDQAIAYAREILDYARVQMAQPRDG
jgi:HEPN domain-containing protein